MITLTGNRKKCSEIVPIDVVWYGKEILIIGTSMVKDLKTKELHICLANSIANFRYFLVAKIKQLSCYGLSLNFGFGGCRHGFGGCDWLGRLGGFNRVGGFGGFDGLGGFDGFGCFGGFVF